MWTSHCYCVQVLPDMQTVRKGQWGVCRSCVWYRLLKYRGTKPNAWSFPGWLMWSKVCSSGNVFNTALTLHAHTLTLFFCILKILIVSFFLCTSRWKSLQIGEKTLWFYCYSILQHSGQQCTERQELTAWCAAGVISLGQGWSWWSRSAPRPGAGYPAWLCPVLWYLFHLLFQRGLCFSLLLQRGCAWAGSHAHVSQRETCPHSTISRL